MFDSTHESNSHKVPASQIRNGDLREIEQNSIGHLQKLFGIGQCSQRCAWYVNDLCSVLLTTEIVNFFYANFQTGKENSPNTMTALANITNLKKLCNHPDLVMEKIIDGTDGFANTAKYLPDGYSKKYALILTDLFFFVPLKRTTMNKKKKTIRSFQRTSPGFEWQINVIGHYAGEYKIKHKR